MKSIFSLGVLSVLLVTASCGSESTASGDVAARVNGKEITTAELEKQFQVRTSTEQPPSQEESQDLKLQLLNQMINDRIVMEMATKAGLTATDAEVEAAQDLPVAPTHLINDIEILDLERVGTRRGVRRRAGGGGASHRAPLGSRRR